MKTTILIANREVHLDQIVDIRLSDGELVLRYKNAIGRMRSARTKDNATSLFAALTDLSRPFDLNPAMANTAENHQVEY